MEVLGTIKKIFPKKTFGNNFKKIEFVIKTNDLYPQNLLIECIQEKLELINKFKVGDNVKVFINLRGREWINPEGEAKYFNSIQAWKIEKINNKKKNLKKI